MHQVTQPAVKASTGALNFERGVGAQAGALEPEAEKRHLSAGQEVGGV